MFANSFSPCRVELDSRLLRLAVECENGAAGRMFMDAAVTALSAFKFPVFSDFPDVFMERAMREASEQDPASYLSAAVSKASGGRVTLTQCPREECGVHILCWNLPFRLQRGNEKRYFALTRTGFCPGEMS